MSVGHIGLLCIVAFVTGGSTTAIGQPRHQPFHYPDELSDTSEVETFDLSTQTNHHAKALGEKQSPTTPPSLDSKSSNTRELIRLKLVAHAMTTSQPQSINSLLSTTEFIYLLTYPKEFEQLLTELKQETEKEEKRLASLGNEDPAEYERTFMRISALREISQKLKELYSQRDQWLNTLGNAMSIGGALMGGPTGAISTLLGNAMNAWSSSSHSPQPPIVTNNVTAVTPPTNNTLQAQLPAQPPQNNNLSQSPPPPAHTPPPSSLQSSFPPDKPAVTTNTANWDDSPKPSQGSLVPTIEGNASPVAQPTEPSAEPHSDSLASTSNPPNASIRETGYSPPAIPNEPTHGMQKDSSANPSVATDKAGSASSPSINSRNYFPEWSQPQTIKPSQDPKQAADQNPKSTPRAQSPSDWKEQQPLKNPHGATASSDPLDTGSKNTDTRNQKIESWVENISSNSTSSSSLIAGKTKSPQRTNDDLAEIRELLTSTEKQDKTPAASLPTGQRDGVALTKDGFLKENVYAYNSIAGAPNIDSFVSSEFAPSPTRDISQQAPLSMQATSDDQTRAESARTESARTEPEASEDSLDQSVATRWLPELNTLEAKQALGMDEDSDELLPDQPEEEPTKKIINKMKKRKIQGKKSKKIKKDSIVSMVLPVLGSMPGK
ncbi:MAG: hypothetical protein HY537_07590 [Deltaproteobacteria bacterium]|nr:hypothetical protein [Deltaproteobacteria bacterium]